MVTLEKRKRSTRRSFLSPQLPFAPICLWVALGSFLILSGVWKAGETAYLYSVDVFIPVSNIHHPLTRKQKLALVEEGDHYYDLSSPRINPIFLDIPGQRKFIYKQKCNAKRFDDFVQQKQEQLATELFKFCALKQQSSGAPVVAFLDDPLNSPWVVHLKDVLQKRPLSSLAIMGDETSFLRGTIHGSFFVLQQKHAFLAGKMHDLIINTSIDVLAASPLLIPRTWYSLISTSISAIHNKDGTEKVNLHPGINSHGDWFLFQQSCKMKAPRRPFDGNPNENSKSNITEGSKLHQCASEHQELYCCTIYDITSQEVIFINRFPLQPYQIVSILPQHPTNDSTTASGILFVSENDELPFVSTVTVKTFQRPPGTPETILSVYDIMQQGDNLPNDNCLLRLRMKIYKKFTPFCNRYFDNICVALVPPLFVSKEVIIRPPLYRKDPSRLIPRILHQTYFEEIEQKRYPNFSRFKESFKSSGWKYNFYTDDDAVAFLKSHFPSEVLSAYNSLLPGALKADLFRYCALLIHGGVYADVDVILESNLDLAIEPDVGFMVPMDKPDACVWQGIIAAAPGHPFLVQAIESIVNQVRNRFTSVDIDRTFCPDPGWKTLHMFDVLFTAGPCMLGASINRVLGFHGQMLFEPGELFPQNDEGVSFVKVPEDHEGAKIPGRTIMLKQNKWDNNAHRFTITDRNIILAATDLENADDLKPKEGLIQPKEKISLKAVERTREMKAIELMDLLENNEKSNGGQSSAASGGGGVHYSKAHAKQGIYGLKDLYVDGKRANENIRLILDLTDAVKVQLSSSDETASRSSSSSTLGQGLINKSIGRKAPMRHRTLPPEKQEKPDPPDNPDNIRSYGALLNRDVIKPRDYSKTKTNSMMGRRPGQMK